MKLTSISEHSNFLQNLVITMSERWYYHRKRVEFGRQTLNISMFTPAKFVDGEWIVLQKPVFKGDSSSHWLENQEYILAQSKVYFEGFEVCHRNEGFDCIVNGDFHLSTNFKYEKTIEDLVKYHLTLTTTAKKQIGL